MTRKQLYMALIVLLLASCGGSGRYDGALRRAQSVLNVRPDSALSILDSLAPGAPSMSRATRMRWQLLRTQAQNKCDTVFRSDSLQLALVDYYDRHGTPNERMTAHYLLGRAYSDMGEAPRALQCFLDAVACADTTAEDCDLASLFRIYGQMAMLYAGQYMPEEELAALEKHNRYARKAGDVFNAIRGMEKSMGAYYDLGDTSSCLRITEQCHRLYAHYGMYKDAAGVYPTAIYIHLKNGNYRRAGELMQIFEEESGLCDSDGNISPGRESYYYSKGLYYLHEKDLYSAEHYFRKLLGFHYNCDFQAYKGLLSLYIERGIADSVSRYASLYESSVDELLEKNQAEAVAQVSAVNDYRRVEHNAEVLEHQMQKTRWTIILFLVFFAFLTTIAAVLFARYKRKKTEEHEALATSYMNLQSQYNKNLQETESLKNGHIQLLDEKEREKSVLEARLSELKGRYDDLSKKIKRKALDRSDIVRKFREMAVFKKPHVTPTSTDWSLLLDTVNSYDNLLYEKLLSSGRLIKQEIYVCILVMLHFSNVELSVLLDISRQRVVNLKSSSNYKLFGEKTASTLSENLNSMSF